MLSSLNSMVLFLRPMCYEMKIVATLLIILEAHMNILFIIHVKILMLIKYSYRSLNHGHDVNLKIIIMF